MIKVYSALLSEQKLITNLIINANHPKVLSAAFLVFVSVYQIIFKKCQYVTNVPAVILLYPMAWTRFLGPHRNFWSTQNFWSTHLKKYFQVHSKISTRNYENKSLKIRESSPLTKYSKRYIPNQNLQVDWKF